MAIVTPQAMVERSFSYVWDQGWQQEDERAEPARQQGRECLDATEPRAKSDTSSLNAFDRHVASCGQHWSAMDGISSYRSRSNGSRAKWSPVDAMACKRFP